MGVPDPRVEAGAAALNEHMKGSGNWRNATPKMAEVVLQAADAVSGGEDRPLMTLNCETGEVRPVVQCLACEPALRHLEAERDRLREALKEADYAISRWENDSPLDRDHLDECDAHYLEYVASVVRVALAGSVSDKEREPEHGQPWNLARAAAEAQAACDLPDAPCGMCEVCIASRSVSDKDRECGEPSMIHAGSCDRPVGHGSNHTFRSVRDKDREPKHWTQQPFVTNEDALATKPCEICRGDGRGLLSGACEACGGSGARSVSDNPKDQT